MSKGLFSAAAIAASVAITFSAPSTAAVIVGSDFGGADLVVSNGDILQGTFTNVGTFTVGAGNTVFVANGFGLSIAANTIQIDGTIDGTGAGFAGAATPVGDAANGLAGTGPGAGAGGLYGGAVHASGGGGGGYGGNGGHSGQSLSSPPFAAGGTAYGSAAPPSVQLGSGGGSAGNHGCCGFGTGGAGGDGGGAVSLAALGNLILNGTIRVDGSDGSQGSSNATYSTSGGGGGSGGGIELSGYLTLNGLLSASGGEGADYNLGTGTSEGWGQGGGGGGGGRIKLSGFTTSVLGGFAIDVSGGSGGAGSSINTLIASEAGFVGSFSDTTVPGVYAEVPEPAALAVFGFGLIGLTALRRRRAA
jgi:hypothetical protein